MLWNAKLVSLRTTANLTPPTRAHHVTQIAESGLHIKLGGFRHPLESLVSRWWAETRHYTWGWCSCHRSTSDAVELLVDPQLALWASSRVVADTFAADSTGRLVWFYLDIKANTRDHEVVLLHVDTEPLTFHYSLPYLELGDIFLVGVCDDHAVIAWSSA